MMQVFVKESAKALAFYEKVFSVKVMCAYPNSDGTIHHAELDVYGQILAISELVEENIRLIKKRCEDYFTAGFVCL